MPPKLFRQPIIIIFLTAILASAGFFVFKNILQTKKDALAQSGLGNHWTEIAWNIPVVFGYAPFHLPHGSYYTDNRGVVLADVNGDGLPDLLQTNPNEPYDIAVYINNNKGDFIYDKNWLIPDDVSFTNFTGGPSIAVDLNGDGWADILNGWYTPSVFDERKAYINNKTGKWTQDNLWKPPVYFYRNEGENGVRLADINKDGLVDVVWALGGKGCPSSPDQVYQEIYLNTGNGWELTADWQLPDYFYFAYLENDYISESILTEMIDVNGDSLADIIQYENNCMDYFAKGVYLNNGNRWELNDQYSVNNLKDFGNHNNARFVKYADVNNDGLVDILRSDREHYNMYDPEQYIDVKEVYLNNGQTGWDLDPNWEIPLIFKTNLINNYWGNYDLQARLADVNGDGVIDLIQSIEIERQGAEKHVFLGAPPF